MSYHVNAFLTDSQGEKLLALKDLTGLNLSELTRRIFDFTFQEHRLNEVVPSYSGRLKDICEK